MTMTIRNFVQQSMSFLALWAFSTAAVAHEIGDTPLLKITEATFGKKFSVSIEHLLSTATLLIIDKEGVVLLEERIQAGSFSRVYNVENLPNGEYDLVLRTPIREMAQPFTISGQRVKASTGQVTESFLPVVNVGEGYVDISLLTLGATPLAISFLNHEGDTVFEDKVRSSQKFERRYRTEQLANGHYTIKIETAEKAFYRDLVVR